MAKKKPYELVYDPEVTHQVNMIDRNYHSLIRRAIEKQLIPEPDVETRNRKPLTRPTVFGTAWEL
jgi:hypothetical protein